VCACAQFCACLYVHARVHVYTRLHIRVSMYILYICDKTFLNQITRTRVDFPFTHVLIPLFHFLLVCLHMNAQPKKTCAVLLICRNSTHIYTHAHTYTTHMHSETYTHVTCAHIHTDISHTYITPPPPSFYRAGRVGIQVQILVTIYTHVHIHLQTHT